jgi:hypothetical protein
MILGLDIGGANTKAASASGDFAKCIYLPLWRHAPLEETLRGFSRQSPKAVAVVMTGELADCYDGKLEGISAIMSAVESSFDVPVHFWGVRGFGWRDPLELAAANWSASASLVSKDLGDCLFVDMGSTTTDLIPIKGKPLAGTTDFQRLVRGELIYMGMLRTSVGALLREAEVDGNVAPLSPEFFAITADAYLASGDIDAEKYTCDTPDGSGKERISSLRRLARTVCSDLEEIGESGALEIASQVRDLQLDILARAIERQSQAYGLNRVVAAGIGEKLIAKAAKRLGLGCTRLSEFYSPEISDVFPAYAVARLLEAQLRLFSI